LQINSNVLKTNGYIRYVCCDIPGYDAVRLYKLKNSVDP
jgi:hypothetical protein